MWASSTSSEQKKMSTDSPVARLDPAVMGEELHRSRHQSLYPAIRRPQVAAGCWRLKADRSIKAPKHVSRDPQAADRRSLLAAGG